MQIVYYCAIYLKATQCSIHRIPGCVVKGGGLLLEKLSPKKKTLQTFIEGVNVNCAMKLRQCENNIPPHLS